VGGVRERAAEVLGERGEAAAGADRASSDRQAAGRRRNDLLFYPPPFAKVSRSIAVVSVRMPTSISTLYGKVCRLVETPVVPSPGTSPAWPPSPSTSVRTVSVTFG
jgi:hypothetical protein